MKKLTSRIAIIGAGNIGAPIAFGILASGIKKGKIILTRKSCKFSDEEKSKFECMADNKKAVALAGIVIVAVLPKQVDGVLNEIKGFLTKEHLLISVATAVTIERIEGIVGNIPIARVTLNIAVRVRQSMTCLAFNNAGQAHEALVQEIFGAVGATILIDEAKFPEATVLCGSGTALAMKFVRAYMQACIQHGFHVAEALLIASQVLKGAAMLIQKNQSHPEMEIDNVTTPDGCTIAALVEMEHSGFSSALLRAIGVGIERARKLFSR